MNPGWQVRFNGWPWWLVLPVAALAVWGLIRLHRAELAPLSSRIRNRLLLLRGSALALILAFLTEPTLTRHTTERALPLVGIMVDRSGSMAVKDELMPASEKLGEAIGLGLLKPEDRPLKGSETEQEAADKELVASAKSGSRVGEALSALAKMSRHERAAKLALTKVLPMLQGKARTRVFAFDNDIAPFDLAKPEKLLPGRGTDFAASFGTLSRLWAQEYVGGVVVVSDGRQTTGVDPTPLLRSFSARDAGVAGILVGDPGTPPDAAVAEISGPGEAFPGETIPLTVRYRISGAPDLDWDMVLTREGKEVERRTMRGNGQWQYETFSISSTNLGVNLYQARLELAREQSADFPLRPSGSVSLELWRNVAGSAVESVRAYLGKRPDNTASLSALSYANQGANYGGRVRGFLIPAQSGNHIFWISSDDASELWLSLSEKTEEKTRVCAVTGYVPSGRWNGEPGQKSAPVALQARHPYYFEMLHKQGGGEDHCSVGWQLPDGTMERPIPGTRLASYDAQSVSRIAEQRKETTRELANRWREASVANNSADFSVAVNQDPIKVLLVDSTPRWESRYLSAMFERDRRINFTRRYHSVIIDDRNLRLLPLNQAEWDAYDMVVLGDLDGNELPQQQQVWLANFVARRGGFLVVVAGPRGMPKAFSLGTLANLLPVRVSLQSNPNAEPVGAVLTPEGEGNPVMQVLNDPGYSQKMWPLLPPLQWVADYVVAKPSASVLLVSQNPAKTPLVAIQRYGGGRVFWMGTEESWRWRDRVGERVHQTFWLQLMRWGLAGRLHGKAPELQVGLDRYYITPGEIAELKARASTKTGEPLNDSPEVTLERIGDNGQAAAGSSKTLAMQPMADAPGLWHLPVGGLEEGLWKITTAHRHPELNGLAETRELSVQDRNTLEGLELGGDLANLNRMAAIGGLRAGRVDQCEGILREFAARLKPRKQEHRQTLRLWNNYGALFIVAALLCTEWVLRKRHGLA
jgi:hypothetical protein